MRRPLALVCFLLVASFFITVAIGQPEPAQAARLTWKCDPDRPRQDVYFCAGGFTHRRIGGGRKLGKVIVGSRGDNSELEDCKATTFRVSLLSRTGRVRESLGAYVCKPGYSMTIYRFRGMRVSRRSRLAVTYAQKLNFDDDERGGFAVRLR